MSLSNWTNDQVLAQLDQWGQRWPNLTITYSFPTSPAGLARMSGEASGFRPVDADQQAAFRLVLQNWDDLIASTFQQTFLQTTHTSSDIEMAYTSTPHDGSYAYVIRPLGGTTLWGSTWLSSSYSNLLTPVVGQYGFETLIHEIGHALGLAHMGNYNAGNGQPIIPSSVQDSVVYSVMSYFGPSEHIRNGEVAQADWTGQNNSHYTAQTPMLHDVMAIQRKYGASTTTRTGDTIYGFSSNITGSAAQIFNFTINLNPILTIWDSAVYLRPFGWHSAVRSIR